MVRIKRGNVARKRRKKILLCANGYYGSHSSLFRTANQQVMKALKYGYIGRKQKKRTFRRIWITRLNTGIRIHSQFTYNNFIWQLKNSQINLNRKILSQMLILDPFSFRYLIMFIQSKTIF